MKRSVSRSVTVFPGRWIVDSDYANYVSVFFKALLAPHTLAPNSFSACFSHTSLIPSNGSRNDGAFKTWAKKTNTKSWDRIQKIILVSITTGCRCECGPGKTVGARRRDRDSLVGNFSLVGRFLLLVASSFSAFCEMNTQFFVWKTRRRRIGRGNRIKLSFCLIRCNFIESKKGFLFVVDNSDLILDSNSRQKVMKSETDKMIRKEIVAVLG